LAMPGTGRQLVALNDAPIANRLLCGAFTRSVSVSPAVQVDARGVQSTTRQNSPATPVELVTWEPNTPGRTCASSRAAATSDSTAARRPTKDTAVVDFMWIPVERGRPS